MRNKNYFLLGKIVFLRNHLILRAEVQRIARETQERNPFGGITVILFRNIVIQARSNTNSL